MQFVEDRLFQCEDQLADDVFELSELIDCLVEGRAPLGDFLGSVASLLGRMVEGDVSGQCLRGLPDGSHQRVCAVPGEDGLDSSGIIFRIDPPVPGWAARFVEQRLGHAVKVLTRNESVARAADGAGDQVRALLGEVGTEAYRAGILRKLGLDSARRLSVIAIAGAGKHLERAERLADALAGETSAPTARVGDVLAVILRRHPDPDVGVPEGLSVGLGEPLPPGRVHESWEGARTALRFSLPSRRQNAPYRMIDAVIVDINKVGCLRVLAEAVDPRGLGDLADIQALHRLVQTGSPETLNVLEAVAATESVRQAAQLVHLHHNTVAHRVEAAEAVLGFPFREVYGRTRLLIALTLYRLHKRVGESRPGATERRALVGVAPHD